MDVTCSGLRLQRGTFEVAADWSLASGASLALIGPSGAGKSLFLSALAGFEAVTAGQIRIGGQDVTDARPADRPLTLMFQDHNLFPHLTLTENVGLGLNPGLRLSQHDRARVAEVLAQVELSGLDARRPSEMSGGQQSRAALARALVRDRPVLLLDEPFAALGPGLRRDMLALVETIRAAQSMTLIYVTHSPEDAARADLASFVEAGTVHPPVAPRLLFDDPPDALRSYL